MRNVYVNTRLFTRKEEEAKLTVANYGWCHTATVTNFLRALTLADIAIFSSTCDAENGVFDGGIELQGLALIGYLI